MRQLAILVQSKLNFTTFLFTNRNATFVLLFPKISKIFNPGFRPAYVCHVRDNVKYTSKKMWHVANLVRGLSVDEALKQLDFINKKGAFIAAEVIREAQEMAVKDHCVEYRSNLWVAESFATKGMVMKGVRRHARMRMSMVKSTLHSSLSKSKCTLIYSLFSV